MTTHQATTRPVEDSVRPASRSDVPALVEILTAAFTDDPVFAWLVPDRARRPALLPAMFALIVEANLPHGEIYTAGPGPTGAAVWVPPGVQQDEAAEERLLDAMVEAAQESADRSLTVLELMAERHPSEPHAYLSFLATRPARQGQGLGSAMLRHVLERCDRDGVPAYLEASSEPNRRLYLRHGFVDAGRPVRLPEGPPMWPMWREPGQL